MPWQGAELHSPIFIQLKDLAPLNSIQPVSSPNGPIPDSISHHNLSPLQAGYVANVTAAKGYTHSHLIHMACSEGDLPTVKMLLALNASISVVDANGKTPIDIASEKCQGNTEQRDNYADIMQLLMDYDARAESNAERFFAFLVSLVCCIYII
jgi:ankyrin repeat protein